MNALYFILAIIAGALIPIQTSSNTVLSKNVGGIIPATMCMFIVATISIILTILVSKTSIPNLTQVSSTPFYSWFGGIIAVIYIMTLVFLAPKLGIGNVTVLIVTGQAISIMLIEHFALFGFHEKPLNLYRIAGVLFLILGVYLIRKF